MKELVVLLSAFFVLAVCPGAMALSVYFDDGDSHAVDDATYQYDSVKLDYNIANDPGTHLSLVDGGLVDKLYTYNIAVITMAGGLVDSLWSCGNGTVTMTGGAVGADLGATNNGTITITSGSVGGSLKAWDNSTVTMSGGSVADDLFAWHNATVSMTGGSVDKLLEAKNNATIYLDGTGFQVGGTVLEKGDKLSDFGTFNGSYYTGTVTGTLSDGAALDNTFSIYNTGEYEGTADIIIGEHCNYVLAGDLDGNCRLDLADLAVVAANWLIDCNANPADPACIPKTNYTNPD